MADHVMFAKGATSVGWRLQAGEDGAFLYCFDEDIAQIHVSLVFPKVLLEENSSLIKSFHKKKRFHILFPLQHSSTSESIRFAPGIVKQICIWCSICASCHYILSVSHQLPFTSSPDRVPCREISFDDFFYYLHKPHLFDVVQRKIWPFRA